MVEPPQTISLTWGRLSIQAKESCGRLLEPAISFKRFTASKYRAPRVDGYGFTPAAGFARVILEVSAREHPSGECPSIDTDPSASHSRIISNSLSRAITL
jgi:hypothetical protein